MSATRRVVLVRPAGVPGIDGLGAALRAAGAEVRELELARAGDHDALLDALEQGYMPVVLKTPAGG